MCSGRHGKVKPQQESLAYGACSICPSSSHWSEHCCTETHPWGPLDGCVVEGMDRSDQRSHVPSQLPWDASAHTQAQGALCSAISCFSCSQLPLMNQWKDEFKAHSRVKCPNSGCWLEFPSIYGLKYHYQRCQGVRRLENCPSFPVAGSSITVCRVMLLSGLKHEERHEVEMGKFGRDGPGAVCEVCV